MRRPLTVGIQVDNLDQLVKDLGVRIRLYKSTLCPNMSSLETMDHDINCTVCNNSMVDMCPKETIALFQQQNLLQQFNIQGTFHIDEVVITFLSGETLHHYSRIDILDFEEDFFELIQRQTGTTRDRLKYPACKVVGLFTVKNDVKTEYHYGADFILDVNGDIQWTGLHKPADKQIYTIYYKYHPVFRVTKAIHRDRFSQFNLRVDQIVAPKVTIAGKTYVKLPETWIAKRDYLIERRDMNKVLLPNNTYYDPNEEPGN